MELGKNPLDLTDAEREEIKRTTEEVGLPVPLVAGELDAVAPREAQERAAAALRSAEDVRLPS